MAMLWMLMLSMPCLLASLLTCPSQGNRSRLMAQPGVTPGYLAAAALFRKELMAVTGTCHFSLEGMDYKENDVGTISSDGMFPSASCLAEGLFCDPSKGGPKGGPNGSLGIGCNSGTCGTTDAIAVGATFAASMHQRSCPFQWFQRQQGLLLSSCKPVPDKNHNDNKGPSPG